MSDMEGIERITQRIQEDASREIEEINARAKAEAQEVLADYTRQAEKESAELLAQGRKAADQRLERLTSVARLEAKKTVLAVKQELVSKAFDQAMEQLSSLPESDYVALLSKLAAGAAKSGREQVILSPKDRARYGKQAVAAANELLGDKGFLTLAEEARPMAGGLVLLADRVEVNCSFEALIQVRRNALAIEVAKILFPETV